MMYITEQNMLIQHSTNQGNTTQYWKGINKRQPNKGLQQTTEQGYTTQYQASVHNKEPLLLVFIFN